LSGQFDKIVCTHWLQRIHRFDVVGLLKHWREHLADDGELYVIVADLKWIADSIHAEWDASPVIMSAIFGFPGEEHRSAFTMSMLRNALDRAGFIAQESRTGPYMLGQAEDMVIARQLFVRATKSEFWVEPEPVEEDDE
jgi:predicted SAM-dependent methyltransferase